MHKGIEFSIDLYTEKKNFKFEFNKHSSSNIFTPTCIFMNLVLSKVYATGLSSNLIWIVLTTHPILAEPDSTTTVTASVSLFICLWSLRTENEEGVKGMLNCHHRFNLSLHSNTSAISVVIFINTQLDDRNLNTRQ